MSIEIVTGERRQVRSLRWLNVEVFRGRFAWLRFLCRSIDVGFVWMSNRKYIRVSIVSDKSIDELQYDIHGIKWVLYRKRAFTQKSANWNLKQKFMINHNIMYGFANFFVLIQLFFFCDRKSIAFNFSTTRKWKHKIFTHASVEMQIKQKSAVHLEKVPVSDDSRS